MTVYQGESLLSLHYGRIHEGDEHVPKKRPKLNTVGIQIQSENLEIEDVLPQLGENVNSEILEDKLEEILPFEQTSILKTIEAEPKKREKPRGWYLNKRYISDI